ncbi:peroxiredoxin [Myxococcota bacterium]|nr:peroxiredoxin [Myxococcota bacterium]
MDVGALAPDFTLTDQHGRKITLSEHRGKKNVVVFFYPKDDTPICTKEVCHFRDHYAELTKSDAIVLGISADSEASHGKFASRHALPYSLLSDPGRAVAAAYGVEALFGLMPGRATFTIDKSGVVRHVTRARFGAEVHVTEAQAALAKLG